MIFFDSLYIVSTNSLKEKIFIFSVLFTAVEYFSQALKDNYSQNKTFDAEVGIYGGSYMSAHVLLNLLNELGKKIRSNGFNKFNNTGTRMQDSVYHMTLKSHFINKFCTKMS